MEVGFPPARVGKMKAHAQRERRIFNEIRAETTL
jgi:hypothetical protein